MYITWKASVAGEISMINRNLQVSAYQRSNHSIGIRDHLIVISTVCCANHTVQSIVKNCEQAVPIVHNFGCGQLGKDADQTLRILLNTGKHPNVGGVLVVGLGCEQNNAHELAEEIRDSGKPAASIIIQEIGGTTAVLKEGIAICQKLSSEKTKIAIRKELPVSELIIGLECGGSDYTSGITANPVIGLVADHFVDDGASVVFGETAEAIGAEHILEKRSINESVSKFILAKIQAAENEAKLMKVDMRGSQPSPGNIAGGLSTISEKSLGAICKSGNRPIVDAIEYGQLVRKKGVTFMDCPGQDLVSLGGLVAGGAHMVLFTTGRGTPLGNAITPVIKITANQETFLKMNEHIDIDLSPVSADEMSMECGANAIIDLMLKVANGNLVQTEKLGHREFGFHSIGPTL
jgi:altronate dehydratase large subunit